MKKKFAGRFLCAALIAAMLVGETSPAYAAAGNENQNVRTEAAVSAESVAEAASKSDLQVYYFDVYGSDYSNSWTINASGVGYKAVVKVNGVECYTTSAGYSDQSYWSVNTSFDVLPGCTYTVVLEVYTQSGDKITRKITQKSSAVTIGSATVSGDSYTTGSTGYNQINGVSLYATLNNSYGMTVAYQIYRSTKPGSGYKKIGAGTTDYSYISYADNTAKTGKTYYYKIKLLSGTNDYVKTSKAISTSGVYKVKCGKTNASFYLYSGLDEDGSPCVQIYVYSSETAANQFDIYRSTKKNSGFKKIKTIYESSYTDSNIRKGVTYYYKIVPKYYNSKTGKVITGEKTEAQGVKYIMSSDAYPMLTQTSKTSMKVSWSSYYYYSDSTTGDTQLTEAAKDSSVSYEVWYRRTDISGTAYRKAAATSNTEYTLKGLAASGTYSVKIRAVKKAGSVVKYEDSSEASKQMGYTDYVQPATSSGTSSALSKNKKTLSIYSTITWERDWGASGYLITATNNYTGKTETIKKITSGKKTSYKFRNVSTKSGGIKYSNVCVTPYKGSSVGVKSEVWGTNTLPSITRVKVKRLSGKSSKVTWTSVKGASIYYVYRTTQLGVTSCIGKTSKKYFVDKHLTTGTTYTYYISASSNFSGVESSYSTATATYEHKLSTPKITSVKNTKSKTAVVKWNKIANAKYYIIYRSTSRNGVYKRVGATTNKKLTYTDKKLAKGKTYYYKVSAKAVGDGGTATKSRASAAKGVKIKK